MPFQKGQSGNIQGRPKNAAMDDYNVALKTVEDEEKMSLLEKFIRAAYKDNTVLIAAVKKLLPDLKQIDAGVFMSGGIYLGHLTEEEIDARIAKLDARLAGDKRTEAGAKKKPVSVKDSKDVSKGKG